MGKVGWIPDALFRERSSTVSLWGVLAQADEVIEEPQLHTSCC
jgi:hypothetical protein